METNEITTALKTKCPKCHNIISLPGSIKPKDVVTCGKCKTSLEVISKLPLTLGPMDVPMEYSSRGFFRK